MSQFALLIISDEDSIRNACRGWVPPGPKVTKQTNNPFTGEPVELVVDVPESLTAKSDCAQLDVVCDTLKTVKPICLDFQLSMGMEFPENSDTFLYGYEEDLGPISIRRIEKKAEEEVVQYFGDEFGEYGDAAIRAQNGLSMFLLPYDF